MTLGEVDLDEMLAIRKPFPEDELRSHDFATYDEVHKLLIENPMFTDQNMLDLMNKVDQGDELSAIQMTSMIRKAWVIKTTLGAMQLPTAPRLPVAKFKPTNVEDQEIEDRIKKEEGVADVELRREHAQRTIANIKDRTTYQLQELLVTNSGEFPDLIDATIKELARKKRLQYQPGSSASASEPRADNPNKIKTMEQLRARSVKPGQTEQFEVNLVVPEDTGYKLMKGIIEEQYPGATYEIRGPDELEIEGKPMYRFNVFIEVVVSTIGRETEDRLQQAAHACMISKGKEDAMPQRMKDTYAANLKAPPKGLRGLPNVGLPGQQRTQDGGSSGSADARASASAPATLQDVQQATLKSSVVLEVKAQLELDHQVHLPSAFLEETYKYEMDEILHTIESLKKRRKQNNWSATKTKIAPTWC